MHKSIVLSTISFYLIQTYAENLVPPFLKEMPQLLANVSEGKRSQLAIRESNASVSQRKTLHAREKHKRKRNKGKNRYRCITSILDRHQTCIEDYLRPPDDSNLIATQFHLVLVQEVTTKVSFFDVIELEEITLEYFQTFFGGGMSPKPICVEVVDIVLARRDHPNHPSIALESIAFQMEMKFDVGKVRQPPKGGPKGDKYHRKCGNLMIALCCPTAINGKCSCCSNRCRERIPKHDVDYGYSYSYDSSDDSYYSGFGSGRPSESDEDDGGARGPDNDFKTVISENSNFRPFRIRYILDGTDTKKVAACSMNQYMEDIYDSSFTHAEYFTNDCDENGGDVTDLYTMN
ncbi:hypothetical protein ACHAXS_013249 [Conticribra weissflogii]